MREKVSVVTSLPFRSIKWLKRIARYSFISLAVIVSGIVVGCATGDIPTSHFETAATDFATANQFRIATYNIRHGRGIDNRVDLERIAEVIREHDIDLIFLQEVDDNWERSGNVNQVQLLAEMTGLKYSFFAPALKIPFGNSGTRNYGNAVLSRYPIVEAQSFLLPRRTLNEPRNLLRIVWMPKPEIRMTLWGTHLSVDRVERANQITLIHTLARAEGFAFLLGDFNSSLSQADVQPIAQSGWIDIWSYMYGEAGATFPSDRPTTRIDYIWATAESLPAVESIFAPPTLASDHLPLIVEINVPE